MPRRKRPELLPPADMPLFPMTPPLYTQDTVAQELAYIGFSDIRHYKVWSGDEVRCVASDMVTPEMAKAIRDVKQRWSPQGRPYVEIMLYDKLKALDMLCKHLGMYITKEEVQTVIDSLDKWAEQLTQFSDMELRNHIKKLRMAHEERTT